MIKTSNRIRLIKLGAVENPVAPTPDVEEYMYGDRNHGLSVPVDYTIEGYLFQDVEVDKPLLIRRTMRNGVYMPGFLTTSYIKSILPTENGLVLKTENSVYRLEWLNEQLEESKE